MAHISPTDQVRAMPCRRSGNFSPKWLAALRFISGEKQPSHRQNTSRTKLVRKIGAVHHNGAL